MNENLEEYTPQNGAFVEVSEGVYRIQGVHGKYNKVGKPPEEQCSPIRKMCLAIILRYYTENHKPAHVRVVRRMLFSQIKKMRDGGEWTLGTWTPGHNFVERRINELASEKEWERLGDGGAVPCVHVGEAKSPWYMPNRLRFPELFDGSK